ATPDPQRCDWAARFFRRSLETAARAARPRSWSRKCSGKASLGLIAESLLALQPLDFLGVAVNLGDPIAGIRPRGGIEQDLQSSPRGAQLVELLIVVDGELGDEVLAIALEGKGVSPHDASDALQSVGAGNADLDDPHGSRASRNLWVRPQRIS